MSITITASEKQILQSVVIPPRPEALLKVSAEAKKPEPDIQLIAQVIASDVGISAAVLQIVNSAAFRRAKKVESIQQAVMTLGLKRLFPLVKSVALKSAMGQSDKLAKFWDEASQVATAASVASRVVGKPQLADNAYMLGLFHNAGIPIMMLKFDDFIETVEYAKQNGWDAANEQERSKYGTSHTTISALLAQKWMLPKVMTEVIYYQLDTDGIFESGELTELALDLMVILKLARCTEHLAANDGEKSTEWLHIEEDILVRLDMDLPDLNDLLVQIAEEMKAT